MGHLLCDYRLCVVHRGEVGLGAFQMISLYVFGGILLAIIIYMAIVSYYM